MTSREKYTAFFGRGADVVLDAKPDDPRSPSVYRFPPTRAGFLKRIICRRAIARTRPSA